MDQSNKAGSCSNDREGNKNAFQDSNDEDEMLFGLRKFRVRSRYSETSNTDAKRRKTCAEGPNAWEEENASLVPKKRKADNLKSNCKSMEMDETKERVERKPPCRGRRTNQSCSKAGDQLDQVEMLEIEGREMSRELFASNCWIDSENEMRTTGTLCGVTKHCNACQKCRERKVEEDLMKLSGTTADEIEHESTKKKRSVTTASNPTTLGRCESETRLHQSRRRSESSEHVSLHPTEFLDNFRPNQDAGTVTCTIPVIISRDESGNSESNCVVPLLMPQRSGSSSRLSLIQIANVETIDTFKNKRSGKSTIRNTSRPKNNSTRKKQQQNKKQKDDVHTLNYSGDATAFRSLHRARAMANEQQEQPEDASKRLTRSSYRNANPPLSPTMVLSSASSPNISTSILDGSQVETANIGCAIQSSVLLDSSESDFETVTRLPDFGPPFNSALYPRHQSIIRNRRNNSSLPRDDAQRVEQRLNFMPGWETSTDNLTPMSNSSTADTPVTRVSKTRRTARMSTRRRVSDQQTSGVLLRQIQADEEFARILQAELDPQGALNTSTASSNGEMTVSDSTRPDPADWTGRTAAERSADILRRINQMTDYEWSVHRAIHQGLDDPPVPPEYVNSPCTIEADILEYLEEERSQGRPFIRESSRRSNEAESTGTASVDVPTSSNDRPQRLAQMMRRHFEDIRHLRRTIADLHQTMQVFVTLDSDDTHRRRYHLPATRLEDFSGLWLNNPGESSFNYEQLLDLIDRLGEVRPRGLDQQSIERIPTTLFSLLDVKEGEDVPLCTICLNAYEEGGVLRVLECNHNFHKSCIDRWLAECRTCPICRVHVEP